MAANSVGQKLWALFNQWGPSVSCTILAYYLGQGAFVGFGTAIGEAWTSVGEWFQDPISFPRWFVIFGTMALSGGGAFLWFKQYQRVRELSKSHDDFIQGLTDAIDDAAKELEQR